MSPSSVGPSAVAGTVPLGAQSLESADSPGLFVTYTGDFAALGSPTASGSPQARQRVTFTVVGDWPTRGASPSVPRTAGIFATTTCGCG
ncbi:hypothetical protein [Streptomyces sp. C8S0]|uniref:hypothetical protein n=1 Tax=Streptomyces sp. C8S0 TaxID=2585716 RepID=UPI001D04FBAF|nr:hypothetical protein [Streptomyces sp. C8S0]